MNSVRENFEKREENFLSDFATRNSKSKGRQRGEKECDIRTKFQRDRDRIIYSNAFRRMKHKTQVFLSPLASQYRTRLTHTIEVAQIARTISRAMRFNEDLSEAIALAHDLGHTPFGHSGETVLKEAYSEHFSHAKQSLRVVDFLEKKGAGLNLSYEVRDGILKHSKGFGDIIPKNSKELAVTIEGQIVRIADIMAYLNHDLEDAIKSKVIKKSDIPKHIVQVLGNSHSKRATTMIYDLIFSSKVENDKFILKMSDKIYKAMIELRSFLYKNVYTAAQVHNDFVKAKNILLSLFNFFVDDKNEETLIKGLKRMEIEHCLKMEKSKKRVVCDYIASMTDNYALRLYSEIFFPKPWDN